MNSNTRVGWGALLLVSAALTANAAHADGTAGTPPSIQPCLDRMTAGTVVDSNGNRTTYANSLLYPKYSMSVALRVCGRNLANWQPAVDCMDRMTGGVTIDTYNRRTSNSGNLYPHYTADQSADLCAENAANWQPAVDCMDSMSAGIAVDQYNRRTVNSGNLYPRYTADQSAYLCRRSGANWSAAKSCLDKNSAGVYTDDYGNRHIYPNTGNFPPRYPVDQALHSCAYAGESPQMSTCMGNLLPYGIDENAVEGLCRTNPDVKAQQCLIGFKLQGLGTLAAIDESTAARICAQNPNSQPADFSRIAQCLNAGSTGQQSYGGANPSGVVPLGSGGGNTVPAAPALTQ